MVGWKQIDHWMIVCSKMDKSSDFKMKMPGYRLPGDDVFVLGEGIGIKV